MCPGGAGILIAKSIAVGSLSEVSGLSAPENDGGESAYRVTSGVNAVMAVWLSGWLSTWELQSPKKSVYSSSPWGLNPKHR